MAYKFINILHPHTASYPIGRGECCSYVSGYYEAPIFANTDALLTACMTELTTIAHRDGREDIRTQHPVIHLTFSRGPDRTTCYVTLREFTRLFGCSWPKKYVESEGSVPELVLTSGDTPALERTNVITH